MTSGDVRSAMEMLGREPESLSVVANRIQNFYNGELAMTIASIPIHQRLVLSSLVVSLSSDIKLNLGQLHSSYIRICSRVNIDSVRFNDFCEMLDNLQQYSLISIQKAKEQRNSKVELKAHKDDLILQLSSEEDCAAIFEVKSTATWKENL
jgi:Cdc6-like AAA superfamily ATPase